MDARYLQDRYPGIGRALYTFLVALSPDEASQVVILCDPERESSRLPLSVLEASGLELLRVPVRTRSLREQTTLPRMARQLRAELVHSPYPFTALGWPCPWVVTVHDTMPLDHPGILGSSLKRAVMRVWLHLAVARARLVLTPSRASAEDVLRRWPSARSRLRVVPNAVDPRFLPATRDEIGRARHRLGLDLPYLLCVAPQRPHKNISRLLEAWSTLPAGDHALVLVGGRPPDGSVGRVAPQGARRGRVVRVDEVPEDDLPAVYSGATAVVVPSLREGFGLPVLEAMACGTPVACSNSTALAEVAGDAAFLFDPQRVQGMAAALQRLIRDGELRSALHHRGLRQAARFPPRRLAERMWAAYEGALRRRDRTVKGVPS